MANFVGKSVQTVRNILIYRDCEKPKGAQQEEILDHVGKGQNRVALINVFTREPS
jgi:hypothetical protein